MSEKEKVEEEEEVAAVVQVVGDDDVLNRDTDESLTRRRQLEEAVEAHPHDPSLRFHLGLFLWEKGGESSESKEKAAQHLVITAKLDPQNASAFKYLGHYYSLFSLDSQRALKCYQRALSLNPDDSESGEALCDLLDQSGKDSLQVATCQEASNKSPRAFWAFRRLGYLHLHHHQWSLAVQTLQHAIRGYPSSPDLWEALGLAYHRLGMFTAAAKSYGRAIELEGTRVFALIESGNIFLMLGSFRKRRYHHANVVLSYCIWQPVRENLEKSYLFIASMDQLHVTEDGCSIQLAVDQFRQALEISPDNVSANYGLASALLGLSKECMNLGAFRWGASLLEDACKVADANTWLIGNFSSIWKLLGDIQLTYSKCFPWMKEDQSVETDVETFSASILSWKQSCELAAISARKSYQRAMHLTPWRANLYVDIAITSDHICSMNENYEHDLCDWQLSGKMALGAVLLEGDNHEFWVALGCLSGNNALRQHSLIRGLQLDVSLAAAWAYLGKLYREEGDNKLAGLAFDCARSIDPSLALPWAGMSADIDYRHSTLDEAFQSCLRAVQILPLAEFQIGLAKLALLSGNLASSQVFVAVQQAVQRAPHYPESHNLSGLVCEARSEYEAAVSYYRLARCAVNSFSSDSLNSHCRDVTINLARALCMAGHAADAVQECDKLKKEGVLNDEGMQIYAFSLWQLGRNDLVLPVVRSLASRVSTMEQTIAAAAVSFICRLLCYISGLDSAVTSILKMPKALFQSSKFRFIVFAIHALDRSNRLEPAISSNHDSFFSEEEIIEKQYLMGLAKLVKHGSEYCLGFEGGISHLKKVIHTYPNNKLIRNLLGHLLVSSDEWEDTHEASRCCIADAPYDTTSEGLKSGWEILGAGTVACYAIGNKDPKFSFPTCGYQCLNRPGALQELQRCLHQEPWSHTGRYLLILNLMQKAREERFPWQICAAIERLIFVALSNELYFRESLSYQYEKFQLLLCASEICLQGGNQMSCIKHAKNALSLPLPNNYRFFGHLLLCRAYAAEGNYINFLEEHARCLELKTDHFIGWICLKIIESQYDVETDLNIIDLSLKEIPNERKSRNMWMAISYLVLGLISLQNKDLVSAQESLVHACSIAGAESCLFLCHGATCMELARQFSGSQFLPLAVRSLIKAHGNAVIPLPIVSILLAQAEGSLGSKEKWEENLRLEWYSWPPEMRPAELFFQMHLLARQSEARIGSSSNVELCQSPTKWVIRAIHTNPACLRYWKVLPKLVE